jgi:hypothetical protein
MSTQNVKPKRKNMQPSVKISKNLIKSQKIVSKVPSMPQQVKFAPNRYDSDESKYQLALSDPFNDLAVGARVPDMYSAPTVTFHSRGTTILKSDTNGILSATMLPNPYATFVDMMSTSISSSSSLAYTVGVSTSIYAATSITALQAQFSSYRVVGVGFKIRNLLPPSTATGRLIVAPVNMVSGGVGPSTLTTTSVYNNNFVNLCTGAYPGALNSAYNAGILAFPSALECTSQDVIVDSLGIFLKPISPDAFAFTNCDTSPTLNATQYYGTGEVVTAATGLIVSADNTGSIFRGGWEAIALRGEGLPVSVNCFEIQYILHYEGTPATGYLAAGTMVPSAPARSVININGFNDALSKALSKQNIGIASDLIATGALGFASAGPAGAIKDIGATILAKLGMQF